MMFKMIIDIFSQNYNSGLFRGCWNPAPPRGRSKSEGGLLDNYHNMIMILTHILTMLTILMILMIRISLATLPFTWPPVPTMFLLSPSCSGGASRRISHIMIYHDYHDYHDFSHHDLSWWEGDAENHFSSERARTWRRWTTTGEPRFSSLR